jgi:hypothetical protein
MTTIRLNDSQKQLLGDIVIDVLRSLKFDSLLEPDDPAVIEMIELATVIGAEPDWDTLIEDAM